MHVLITTDTLSGVWTYTRELVTGLTSRGIRVTLVSLGEIPLPHQVSWMDTLQAAWKLVRKAWRAQTSEKACGGMHKLAVLPPLRPQLVQFLASP